MEYEDDEYVDRTETLGLLAFGLSAFAHLVGLGVIVLMSIRERPTSERGHGVAARVTSSDLHLILSIFIFFLVCSTAVMIVCWIKKCPWYEGVGWVALWVGTALLALLIMFFVAAASEKGWRNTLRPLNRCHKCRYTWFPRGKDVSSVCPRCNHSMVSTE